MQRSRGVTMVSLALSAGLSGCGQDRASARGSLPTEPVATREAVHRLNAAEYNATVADVLGTKLEPASASWRGGELLGLDNMAAVLSVDCAFLDCAFDGTSSTDGDGTITSYTWDFGDGETGTGPTPGHTYAAAGTYTVTLVVTDDDDATGEAVTTRTVVGAPAPTTVSYVGGAANQATSRPPT